VVSHPPVPAKKKAREGDRNDKGEEGSREGRAQSPQAQGRQVAMTCLAPLPRLAQSKKIRLIPKGISNMLKAAFPRIC